MTDQRMMTPRQKAIALRVLANACARYLKKTPHGPARDVIAYVSLVQAEMEAH